MTHEVPDLIVPGHPLTELHRAAEGYDPSARPGSHFKEDTITDLATLEQPANQVRGRKATRSPRSTVLMPGSL